MNDGKGKTLDEHGNERGVSRNEKKRSPRIVELQSAWIIRFKRHNAQRPPKAASCSKSEGVSREEKKRNKRVCRLEGCALTLESRVSSATSKRQ